jgi:hypothetical protein
MKLRAGANGPFHAVAAPIGRVRSLPTSLAGSEDKLRDRSPVAGFRKCPFSISKLNTRRGEIQQTTALRETDR